MQTGYFYFIKDEFYQGVQDDQLLPNKDPGEAGRHDRPCHYCFEYEGYLWMIPISSKVEKYQRIYDHKIEKRGNCDGIRFGYVNGRKSAFLIQNCFPTTEKYIAEQYFVERGTVPVKANEQLTAELNALIRKVVRLYKKGINMPFTDIGRIMAFLENDK